MSGYVIVKRTNILRAYEIYLQEFTLMTPSCIWTLESAKKIMDEDLVGVPAERKGYVILKRGDYEKFAHQGKAISANEAGLKDEGEA